MYYLLNELNHDVVKKLKGRRQVCLSTGIMSHKLLFNMDPCALLITAGCFNSAGKHVCVRFWLKDVV